MEERNVLAWFNPKLMGEGMLKLTKFSVDTTFNSIAQMQDFSERAWQELFETGKKVQEDAAKTADQFVSNMKQGRDEYRKIMEDGLRKAEDMLYTEK